MWKPILQISFTNLQKYSVYKISSEAVKQQIDKFQKTRSSFWDRNCIRNEASRPAQAGNSIGDIYLPIFLWVLVLSDDLSLRKQRKSKPSKYLLRKSKPSKLFTKLIYGVNLPGFYFVRKNNKQWGMMKFVCSTVEAYSIPEQSMVSEVFVSFPINTNSQHISNLLG